jgi:hypothetical protein
MHGTVNTKVTDSLYSRSCLRQPETEEPKDENKHINGKKFHVNVNYTEQEQNTLQTVHT